MVRITRQILLVAIAAAVLVLGLLQLSRPAQANLSCITVCQCGPGIDYCSGHNQSCSGGCQGKTYQNCCAWCQTVCGQY